MGWRRDPCVLGNVIFVSVPDVDSSVQYTEHSTCQSYYRLTERLKNDSISALTRWLSWSRIVDTIRLPC